MILTAMWVTDSGVSACVAPEGEAEEAFLSHDGDWDHNERRWRVPIAKLASLCSTLDRDGVVWAVDWQVVPMTWAERLCAELPEALAGPVVRSVRHVLESSVSESAGAHMALLDQAWSDATTVTEVRRGHVVETERMVRTLAKVGDDLAPGEVEVVYVTHNGGVVRSRDGIDTLRDLLSGWRKVLGPPAQMFISQGAPLWRVTQYTKDSTMTFAFDPFSGTVEPVNSTESHSPFDLWG